jgi:hypothetical protein
MCVVGATFRPCILIGRGHWARRKYIVIGVGTVVYDCPSSWILGRRLRRPISIAAEIDINAKSVDQFSARCPFLWPIAVY